MATVNAPRPQAYPQYAPGTWDPEKGEAIFEDDLVSGDAMMRLGFIRKVFGEFDA